MQNPINSSSFGFTCPSYFQDKAVSNLPLPEILPMETTPTPSSDQTPTPTKRKRKHAPIDKNSQKGLLKKPKTNADSNQKAAKSTICVASYQPTDLKKKYFKSKYKRYQTLKSKEFLRELNQFVHFNTQNPHVNRTPVYFCACKILARINLDKGDYKQARTELNNIYPFKSHSIKICSMLAEAYQKTSEVYQRKYQAHCDEKIEGDDDELINIFFETAKKSIAENNVKGAETNFQVALSVFPHSPSVYKNLSDSYKEISLLFERKVSELKELHSILF